MIRKGYSFDDVLLVPRYNDIPSRKDVDTSVQFGNFELQLPVLSSNMDTVTGHMMANKMFSLGGMGVLHRFCTIQENIDMYHNAAFRHDIGMITPWTPNGNTDPWIKEKEAVISLGVNEDLERFEALYAAGARYFCVDVAHGHTKAIGKFVKQLKQNQSGVFVIAGNVATHAGADYLASCGADAIKVGIGPGSVCTTRIKTGCGVPQLTAIMDCAKVDRIIIADGGIRTPGDAVKALAAGAHVVMLGGMLAGCNETPGDFAFDVFGDGKPCKIYRGMASKEAQEDFMGAMAEWKAAEGIQIKVRAKGPIADVLNDLMGGIRSGMTYCGAKDIAALHRNAEFIEVTANGVRENAAHGEGRL